MAESEYIDLNVTSQVSWATTSDVDYYILVGGFSDEADQYTLNIMVRHRDVFPWFLQL